MLVRSASRAAILSVSMRCSTARFSRRRSRSANEVERPRTVLRALVFVIVFRTSTVYRACWLCDAIEATHNHGAQTSPPSGSWFRGCWAVADDRAIEARPSASRSRPGCADAVLPGRRLWWLRRPSRATQPLPVVPTPDGAGTTFKTLQVRLLISCSVLSLGTRFASPKTTEAVRSPSDSDERTWERSDLEICTEGDRTASVVTLLALSGPEADHELR